MFAILSTQHQIIFFIINTVSTSLTPSPFYWIKKHMFKENWKKYSKSGKKRERQDEICFHFQSQGAVFCRVCQCAFSGNGPRPTLAGTWTHLPPPCLCALPSALPSRSFVGLMIPHHLRRPSFLPSAQTAFYPLQHCTQPVPAASSKFYHSCLHLSSSARP